MVLRIVGVFAAALFVLGASPSAEAQVSKSQVKRDLMKSGVKSVKVTSKGSKRFDRLGRIYISQRHATVTRPYKQIPGVDVEVLGWAEYHSKNGRKWNYHKFYVAENRYKGIPDPTEKMVVDFVKKDLQKFYGYHFYKIVNDPEGPKFPPKPKFTWHTPKSVTALVWTKFEVSVSNFDLETIEQIYAVRMYRDSHTGPWKSFISSPYQKDGGKKLISKRKISAEEMRTLPTLASRHNEQAAKAELAKLPQIEIPNFQTAEELFMFAHKILREGNPDKLKAFLLRTLSSWHFVEGSSTVLNGGGARTLKAAIEQAYGKPGKYKDQYCRNPVIDRRRTTATRIYIAGAVNKLFTSMAAQKSGGKYVNGVRTGQTWKFSEFSPRTRQDKDALEFIASFTDRKKLCPND